MEKLLYARWAQQMEIDDLINGIRTKNKKDYQKSLSYLQHHKQNILKQYDLLSVTFEEMFKESFLLRMRYHKALDNDTCICGGQIVYVEPFNFYGCVNFKDDSQQHFNFRNVTEPEKYIPRVCYVNTSNWVVTLKHKSSLPKTVTTASLYQFILNSGLECIYEKYTGESIRDKMNNYRDAIKKGVTFEKDVHKILIEKHDRVYYHQAIKYQYHERQQLFAIPDFIAVTDSDVIIYECKVKEGLCDDRQKQKYLDLVSFIMNEKRMEQQLSFVYVFMENNKIVFNPINK